MRIGFHMRQSFHRFIKREDAVNRQVEHAFIHTLAQIPPRHAFFLADFGYTARAMRDTDISNASRGVQIKIELAKPQKKKTAIAGTALFPIQHSRELLAAAQREESVFEADLYDGSEKGEKVYATTAVIGRIKPDDYNSALPAVENSQKLAGLKSWPVSLSYFEPGKGLADAVPTYELAFLLFENGIVRKLTLDYGDFALKGDLKALTVHETPKCEPKGR